MSINIYSVYKTSRSFVHFCSSAMVKLLHNLNRHDALDDLNEKECSFKSALILAFNYNELLVGRLLYQLICERQTKTGDFIKVRSLVQLIIDWCR